MSHVRHIEYFMNDKADKNPYICFGACQDLQDPAKELKKHSEDT